MPRIAWASGSIGCGSATPASIKFHRPRGGKRFDRLRPGHARVDQIPQAELDQAQAVARFDLPPRAPAEHRWRIEQGDLPNLRLPADVEEELEPSPHRLPRVRLGQSLVGEALGELRLDLLEHRGEQTRLPVEVVIEGSPGHTGRADDLLGPDAPIASLREEPPRSGDQGGLGCLGSLGLRSSLRRHFHTVCMLLAYCLYVTYLVEED